MKKFSFPFISSPTARVLILGTMPGEMSLKLNQYYGHGGNHFWKLMFSIYNESFSSDYEKRKDLLIRNDIALWDVLKACVREGSADSAILEEEANDFIAFFARHPEIRLIAFNGKNAHAYFMKYCKSTPDIATITLPSTSSANTWKTFEDKFENWKQIKLDK